MPPRPRRSVLETIASFEGVTLGPWIAWTLDTMLAHISSLAALQSDDGGLLVAELRLARLRSQVAIVRALADHVEYLARPQDTKELGDQVIEEMARLGSRLLEAAAALAASPPPEGAIALSPWLGSA
jgi:hypothetical protein